MNSLIAKFFFNASVFNFDWVFYNNACNSFKVGHIKIKL